MATLSVPDAREHDRAAPEDLLETVRVALLMQARVLYGLQRRLDVLVEQVEELASGQAAELALLRHPAGKREARP